MELEITLKNELFLIEKENTSQMTILESSRTNQAHFHG